MAVLAFVIGVLVIVVGLAVSIGLHEIGHLIPAKLFGVRVGQYMIGMGRTLWSKQVGETEYGVKMLPIGGYISMAGMYPAAAPSDLQAAAAADPAAAGPADARPGKAGGGFFRIMVQDARDANAESIGEDADRTFSRLPVFKRIIVMLGGPVMNLLLAIVLFTIVFSGLGVQTAIPTLASVSECLKPATASEQVCASADPQAPAAAAQLEPGDRIVSIGGTAVTTFQQVTDIVSASPNTALPISVQREGRRIDTTVTPALTQRYVLNDRGEKVLGADGKPEVHDIGMIGVVAATEMQRQPIWAGPEQAVSNIRSVVGVVAQLPAKVYNTAVDMVTGKQRDPDGPISVVGVGVIAGQVAATDSPIVNRVAAVLALLGSLNIALFVFNLVPLLPLDGGHVVVALWDGAKRAWAKLFRRPPPKPVDATKLVPITFVVVVLLIGMSAILLLADIFNPVQLFN